MSAGWEAGDLALCIHPGPWWDGKGWNIPGPALGTINLVADVGILGEDICLKFDEWEAAYEASCFLKITPPEADTFDREVIAALTGQPEQVPA